ncbi:Lipase 1 [Candida viswanathii]|uniref:Lipase 1 n=1 Tax=Candida viswanathii TaxID=5486 RepID=A0A367XVJ8_9ASCO|nr:Lipase 1 [Candida viswanathii]
MTTNNFEDPPPPRPVRNLLFFHVPLKNSWQLLVRSEDSFGNPNAIVTTVLEPHNSDPTKILSYQTFEDSTALKCATSYNFQVGIPPFGNVATQLEMKFLVPALRKGYFVVSPNYNGPKGTFTAGFQSAHAVLNSLRGVLSSGNITGINPEAKVVLWGYSGGSLASSWAASVQPEYAPDLANNLAGVALGGFVTNITSVAEAADRSPLSGLVPLALNGWETSTRSLGNCSTTLSHPGKTLVSTEVSRSVSPSHRVLPWSYDVGTKRRAQGVLPKRMELARQSGFLLRYQPEQLDFVPWQTSDPRAIYHGAFDAVVPIEYVRKTYDRWCAEGIGSLEFAEAITTGHVLETFGGAVAAWTWIQKRFNGEPAYQGCFHTRRLTNLKYHGASKSVIDYFDGLRKDSNITIASGEYYY